MFSQMKLGLRAILAIGVVVVMMVALGAYNASRIRAADESDAILYEQNTVPLGLLSESRVALNRAHADLVIATTTDDAALRSERLRAFQDHLRDADDGFGKLDRAVKLAEMREPLTQVARDFRTWRESATAAAADLARNNRDAALKSELAGGLSRDIETVRVADARLGELLVKHASSRAELNTTTANTTISLTWMLIAVTAVLGAILGLFTYTSISGDIRKVHREAEELAADAVAGKLASRADADRVSPEFRGIVEAFNHVLDAVINPLNVAASYVDRISKGDIPPKISDSYNGDFNTIKGNLNTCVDALGGLVEEMNRMSAQHDAGEIDASIPAERFAGAYRTMASGINDMVKGHIGVKKKAMACVGEFGRGNFEAPLERFPGKKAFINDTIEQVRTNLKALMADANMLSRAAVDGKLATRADASRHQGDFRKIVQGVNETLDAVINPLNVAANYVDRISKGDIPPKITDTYHGDFNTIKNNLNTCVDALSGLVEDMNRMSTQHDLGDIDVMIPVERFAGAYRTMATRNQRHGEGAHRCQEEGHGLHRRVRARQLRGAPRAVPRQEGLYQRHHRAGSRQPQGVDCRC